MPLANQKEEEEINGRDDDMMSRLGILHNTRSEVVDPNRSAEGAEGPNHTIRVRVDETARVRAGHHSGRVSHGPAQGFAAPRLARAQLQHNAST